jgi:hypothetical protein
VRRGQNCWALGESVRADPARRSICGEPAPARRRVDALLRQQPSMGVPRSGRRPGRLEQQGPGSPRAAPHQTRTVLYQAARSAPPTTDPTARATAIAGIRCRLVHRRPWWSAPFPNDGSNTMRRCRGRCRRGGVEVGTGGDDLAGGERCGGAEFVTWRPPRLHAMRRLARVAGRPGVVLMGLIAPQGPPRTTRKPHSSTNWLAVTGGCRLPG